MAPTRSRLRATPSDPSSSSSTRQKRPHHQRRVPTDPNTSSTPGVQKVKSSLRQVRRLLAKDSLAADARVAAERRLKALEGELETAERTRREREMAVRYHKVKFFERQKVTRKISQVKRELGKEDLGKKEKAQAEKALFELRVDLNYILHYPKAEKYVSLFPPAARGKDAPEADEAAQTEQLKTDKQREEVRAEIRTAMQEGRVSGEPEGEKEKREVVRKGGEHRQRDETTKRKAAPPAQDDFFEAASEEEGEDVEMVGGEDESDD